MKLLKNATGIASIAALFLIPVSAQSADLGRSGEVYTPADAYVNTPAPLSWTGLSIAALGGYQFSNTGLDIDALDGEEKVFALDVDGFGQDGFFGEGQIGFDQQVGKNALVGAFVGLDVSGSKFSIDASADGDSANLVSFEQEWGGVVGIRAGVLPTNNTLMYLAGGFAFGELDPVTSGGEAVFEAQDTDLTGWFAEAGVETRLPNLGNNVFFTVAGRYTDYNDVTLLSEEGVNIEVDHSTLSAMAGLKIKLGSPQ